MTVGCDAWPSRKPFILSFHSVSSSYLPSFSSVLEAYSLITHHKQPHQPVRSTPPSPKTQAPWPWRVAHPSAGVRRRRRSARPRSHPAPAVTLTVPPDVWSVSMERLDGVRGIRMSKGLKMMSCHIWSSHSFGEVWPRKLQKLLVSLGGNAGIWVRMLLAEDSPIKLPKISPRRPPCRRTLLQINQKRGVTTNTLFLT